MPKRLTWEDWNSGLLEEDGIRVYKSTSPMDTGAMPAPLADLAAGTTTYDDPDDAGAYYRVSAYKGSPEVERFSDEVFLTPIWDVASLDGAIIVKEKPIIGIASSLDGAIVVRQQPLRIASSIDGAIIVKSA